jgi:hypothetical protein
VTSPSMIAEEFYPRKHNGDEVQADLARPLGDEPRGSVVIHHMPDWDPGSIEITC